MDLFGHDDPLWVRDFQTALRDLLGEQLRLPAPEVSVGALRVPPREDVDISTLEGAALRVAILQKMKLAKTANPFIREVHWDGVKVGQVAQSPWRSFLWLSSADKRIPFSSLTEAAVFTVAEYLEATE